MNALLLFISRSEGKLIEVSLQILEWCLVMTRLLHRKINEIRWRPVMKHWLIILFWMFLLDLCKLKFECFYLVLKNSEVLVDFVQIVYFYLDVVSLDKQIDCLLAGHYFCARKFSFHKSELFVVTTKIAKLTFSLAT